jgi:hypothetical protein
VADGDREGDRDSSHLEVNGQARVLHAGDQVGQVAQVLERVERRRPVVLSAQCLQRGPQLSKGSGGGGRYLIQRGGPVGATAFVLTARGG